MTAKEYLEQVSFLDEEIHTYRSELAELRDFAESIASAGFQSASKSNVPKDKTAETVAKIMELERKIDDRVNRLVELKIQIYYEIDKLPAREEKLLLKYRYLQFHTWEQIAEEMNYSERNVYYIHKRALRTFESLHCIADRPVV